MCDGWTCLCFNKRKRMTWLNTHINNNAEEKEWKKKDKMYIKTANNEENKRKKSRKAETIKWSRYVMSLYSIEWMNFLVDLLSLSLSLFMLSVQHCWFLLCSAYTHILYFIHHAEFIAWCVYCVHTCIIFSTHFKCISTRKLPPHPSHACPIYLIQH